jgi:hypothetical protein
MFIGAAFLLGSLNGISQKYILPAFFFFIIGAGSAFFAIKLNKRALYLFFASFFILAGFFLFLSALRLFPFSLKQAWPLISVFSGLALIPAGWRKYGAFRSKFIVPAVGFTALGGCLLIFSFRVVSFHFKQFMLNWWPLFIVLAGILLVLLALSTKIDAEGKNV